MDQETLDQFRKSFSYGPRNDLFFKFLASKSFTDKESGQFFQGLLWRLGDAIDTGDYGDLADYVFHWQVHGYAPQGREGGIGAEFRYETAPWTPLKKRLSSSRVALISAGGLYVEGDDPLGPEGLTQEEAIARVDDFFKVAPTLSVIPKSTSRSRLRVRHPGYDIRAALRDHNVVFPIDRLKELEDEGVIGELSEENYSFVGATSQVRLLREAAPKWAQLLKSRQVDAVLLVAA